jgi:hypothetical protein
MTTAVINNVASALSQAADNYSKPTPSKWRKIGDLLLTIGSTVTSISAFTMPPIVTAAAAILTAIGKVMTNFATE